jgi:hypothetical protein
MGLFLYKLDRNATARHDELRSVVVAARNGPDARAVVASSVHPGDEGSGAWLDEDASAVFYLGPATGTGITRGVICADFKEG